MNVEKHRKLEPAAMLFCSMIQCDLCRPSQVHPISNFHDEALIHPAKIGDMNYERFHLRLHRELRVFRTSELLQSEKMNELWGKPVKRPVMTALIGACLLVLLFSCACAAPGKNL